MNELDEVKRYLKEHPDEYDAEAQKIYLDLAKEKVQLERDHERLGRKMKAHEKTWVKLKKLFEQYSQEHDEIGQEAVRLEQVMEELDGRIEDFYHEHDKGEIVPPEIDKNGNVVVTLEKNGVSEKVPVAYMVAKTFVPNPKNLPYVRHKDGNKMNNRADNLEWSDTEE